MKRLVMESVSERDIDLLIINKFITDHDFVVSFCNAITKPEPIDISDICVEKVQHSKSDNDGETDIFVLLKNSKERIALFIENKIDAKAMPEQHARYLKRAKKGISKKEYDSFRIIMISPKDYDNEEAGKYENRISYEEIRSMVKDEYSVSLINEAVRERKKGYEVVEDTKVTQFRNKYYQFVKENYGYLSVREVNGPAGTNAVWVTFDSFKKGTYIQHKSYKGYVDLEISGYGNKVAELRNANKELLLRENMHVAIANKSAAIRVVVPKMDFHEEFENYLEEIHEVCKAVDRLQRIVTEIDYDV